MIVIALPGVNKKSGADGEQDSDRGNWSRKPHVGVMIV
jgi:hypothetical protein